MKPKPLIIGEEVAYRTVLMARDVADRFCKCLAANASRFKEVTVQRSHQAKGDKCFFVSYVPLSPRSVSRLKDDQSKGREGRARAALENGDLEIFRDPDDKRIYWIHSLTSGETYQVTPEDCTCPDHETRCRKLKIRCKHRWALYIWWSEYRNKSAA